MWHSDPLFDRCSSGQHRPSQAISTKSSIRGIRGHTDVAMLGSSQTRSVHPRRRGRPDRFLRRGRESAAVLAVARLVRAEVCVFEPRRLFRGDDKILAGVVEPTSHPICSGDTWDLEAALHSPDDAERYAAVKAAGATERRGLLNALSETFEDASEDWRIRLEACFALARLDPDPWIRRATDQITHPDTPADQQMEAVLAISELPSRAASEALHEVASRMELPTELRAAAAWGLGQGRTPRPELLMNRIDDEEPTVVLHAIAAIDELPDHLEQALVGWMAEGDAQRASAAAQLLQRHSRVDALLDACQLGGNARLWALRALGELPPPLVRSLVGDRLTPDIEQTLLPMWLGQDDWLRQEGKEGLDALDIQKIRFH